MRSCSLGLLVAVGLLLGGCSFAASGGSLTHYDRNASAGAVGIRVDSMAGQGGVLIIDEDRGCVGVAGPWTLSFGPADIDGPLGEYSILLTSAQVADPTNAVIWIDVARDGSVTWGEGKPEWAVDAGPIHCGSSE
jgi:hypothetical protein